MADLKTRRLSLRLLFAAKYNVVWVIRKRKKWSSQKDVNSFAWQTRERFAYYTRLYLQCTCRNRKRERKKRFATNILSIVRWTFEQCFFKWRYLHITIYYEYNVVPSSVNRQYLKKVSHRANRSVNHSYSRIYAGVYFYRESCLSTNKESSYFYRFIK